MPGRCWVAVQWRRRSGRGAGTVTAEPSWVAERSRHRGPGEVGPPSRWSPVARMSGRRPAGCCPVRVPGPAVGVSVRPTGRADVQRPRVRCPGVRCIQVSGRTGLRCPRRCRRAVRRWTLAWLGVAGRPRLGPPVDVPRGPRAAWSPARIGPGGKRWWGVGRGWLTRGLTVAQGRASRLRRRLAAGPTRALVQARVPAGWRGSMGQSRCSPAPQGVLGGSPAWCPTMAWTRRR
jgi:hypothetical protein